MVEKIARFPTPEASEEQGKSNGREFATLRLSSARVYRRLSPNRAQQATDAEALARVVGQNIGKFRRRHGLTQEKLAEAIGCDRSAVCHWEAGNRLPTLEHLVALGRALGCSARALLPEE